VATLQELIRRNNQRPIRRCYIKRRNFSGNYESSWTRIDNWKNRDRVFNWGSISFEINHLPAQISTVNASNISMTFDNQDGHFNVETSSNSIWKGFIGRKYTKLKIDCGYLDSDDSEIGVVNVFEGVIDKVIISENQTAKITILNYITVLKRFDIKDLSLAATDRTIENLMSDIMNQSKITQFIPYVAADPAIASVNIDDPTLLEGTYWNNILKFTELTNSTPLLVGDTWTFAAREAGAVSQWDFKGYGADAQPDIFKITSYDDEGSSKVRLRFQEQDGALYAISDNGLLLTKYLATISDGSEVQQIDMSDVKAADKQNILNQLVDYWQTERPVIEFESKFMVNYLKPTDRITIEVQQAITPKTGVFRIGISKLGTVANGGSGHVLGKAKGAINISSGRAWMVTKIIKDINTWKCKIKAEEIIT